MKLGKALGTSAEWWLNLQAFYDLRTAQRDGVSAEAVDMLVPA